MLEKMYKELKCVNKLCIFVGVKHIIFLNYEYF